MMKTKSLSKIILLVLCTNVVFGQSFTTSSKVVGVKTDGLHSMLITPQIRSFSKSDLSDIRIFDKANQVVPYWVLQEPNQIEELNFELFKIILKEIVPDKKTTIIVENAGQKPLSEIQLKIASSSLTKWCNISGSNDQQQWFGLLDKYSLTYLQSSESANIYKSISLPLSTYRYLKFEIDDKKNAPLNVLQVGSFKHFVVNATLQNLPPKSSQITTDIAQKKTRIKILFDQPQAIDKVIFEIAKPNFYRRNARLLVNKQMVVKKKPMSYLEPVANFVLNSSQTNAFYLPHLFEKEIIVEIDNEDNPPLSISATQLQQFPVYLIADLKANEVYTLKTGDPSLQAPTYDLGYFKDKIQKPLPEAKIAEVTTSIVEINQTSTSFWQKPWFMWVCIGLGGLMIFIFASSLLKDMEK